MPNFKHKELKNEEAADDDGADYRNFSGRPE
jgi:hypothetical protein